MDQYCRPVTAAGLYKSPSNRPAEHRPRPKLRQRTFENVTPYQRRDLINWCWGMYCQIPNVRAAVNQKTNFACSDACYVEYHGANKAWGKAMEEYINGVYYSDCNLAGANYDFHTTLHALSVALETKGQLGWVFDEASQKVKFIPATCIGNGFSPDSKPGKIYELGTVNGDAAYWGLSSYGSCMSNMMQIETGPFKGFLIIDGIILTRNMQHVGTRVLGFDEEGKATHADIGIDRLGLIFEPKMEDEIFGVPGLSPIVNAVATVDDWNYYIGQAMKLSASFAVTRKSKDGKPAMAAVQYSTIDETLPSNTADGVAGATRKRVYATEVVEAGIVELATDNDEEIGHVPFERPSMNEETFIERIETGLFAEIWPREFIYTSDSARAGARMSVVQARQLVWKRHQTLTQRFARPWIDRKIAAAMASGELPPNNAGLDPYFYGFSFPAEISVDEGNDAKIDLQMLGRGATSHRIVCAKTGHNEERIEEDFFTKRDRLMTKAKEMAAAHPEWTAKEILAAFDNLGNANQPMPVEPQGDEEPPPLKKGNK